MITPGAVQPHAQGHRRRGRKGAGHGSGAAQPDAGLLRPAATPGHFGLALGSYAHFTSPIRRYADLLVHRALVDAFELEQPAAEGQAAGDSRACPTATATICRKVTEAISKTERRAMEAERDTIDRYVAAWLSGRVGEVFETRITGVQSFGFFATIVGLGGDGLVPVSTLGARVLPLRREARARWSASRQRHALSRSATGCELRLAEANPLTGALKFELLDGDGARSSRAGDRPRARKRQAARRKHPHGQARPARATSATRGAASAKLASALSSAGRSPRRSARRGR